MIKSNVLANAAATIMAATYVICRLIAGFAPGLLFSVSRSWFHTLSLEADQLGVSMTFGMFLLGLVSSVGVTWVLVYATAELYNRWAK